MDYKKTSILLKKIKSLHNTLMDNADQPSSIEKQLMQSYLRDFYDSFVSGEGATDIFADESQTSAKVQEAIPAIPAIPMIPPISISEPIPEARPEVTPLQKTTQESVQETIQETIPAVETNTTAPILEETVEAIEDTTIITNTTQANQPPIEQDKLADAKTDVEMVHSGKDIAKQLVNDPVDQDLLALFTESPITDLSDKLALLPIRDLTKALSINERFFTIQELFGGDSDLFQATLQKLNGYSDFEQASQELMGSVATDFDWSSAQKQKKASNFIKLVRRRYQ